MTIAEAVMEKVKKLPLEKQEEALRYVESLQFENEAARQKALESFSESLKKGFLKGPVIPFNRDELYDRDAH